MVEGDGFSRYLGVENIGVHVDAIGPSHGPGLGIDLHLGKVGGIPQRGEDALEGQATG